MKTTKLDAHASMIHNGDFSGKIAIVGMVVPDDHALPPMAQVWLSSKAMKALVAAYLADNDEAVKEDREEAEARGFEEGRRRGIESILDRAESAIHQALLDVKKTVTIEIASEAIDMASSAAGWYITGTVDDQKARKALGRVLKKGSAEIREISTKILFGTEDHYLGPDDFETYDRAIELTRSGLRVTHKDAYGKTIKAIAPQALR